jgi:hypothetical protein
MSAMCTVRVSIAGCPSRLVLMVGRNSTLEQTDVFVDVFTPMEESPVCSCLCATMIQLNRPEHILSVLDISTHAVHSLAYSV